MITLMILVIARASTNHLYAESVHEIYNFLTDSFDTVRTLKKN